VVGCRRARCRERDALGQSWGYGQAGGHRDHRDFGAGSRREVFRHYDLSVSS